MSCGQNQFFKESAQIRDRHGKQTNRIGSDRGGGKYKLYWIVSKSVQFKLYWIGKVTLKNIIKINLFDVKFDIP